MISGTRQSQQLGIDLSDAADQLLPGFRLQRIEVLNWGTFNNQVWSLNLDGKNALLTGDIGSGKSTLVDAVTTLLVPSHRVAYNKAAGADFKERNLRSYVLGYYRSERNETSGTAKPVALRSAEQYSVILGVFKNLGYDQTVTIAQVFWMKDPAGRPERMYVCAESALNISRDFSDFGTEVSGLRKKLKGLGCELFDSFPPYGAWFRRRFAIENEQALELFHQTVSMKSVGNLTEFVRNHMLEPFDVETRIEGLIKHFDDLNSAHEAVLRAGAQVESLTPIVDDCRQHAEVSKSVDAQKLDREALRPYFLELKLKLIETKIEQLNQDWQRLDNKVQNQEQELSSQRGREEEIKRSIAENGGDRIERLASEISAKEETIEQRKRKDERYSNLVRSLSLSPAADADAFTQQKNTLHKELEHGKDQEATLLNAITEVGVSFKESQNLHNELTAEINSLRARRSNIPGQQIRMRADLCAALNCREDEMPFAGELLQVREEERDWEGAVERVLHNFGLSLLVPDDLYSHVADWVDRTQLRGRIVYFRVRSKSNQDRLQLNPDSMVDKLSIKPDSPYFDWLERELAIRFDYVCCETQEQFRRQTRALTKAGQIKAPGERHEKDDRHRIDDRGRFILGWTNEAKIRALEAKAKQLEAEIREVAARLSSLQTEQTSLKLRLETLSKLEEYTDFRELDWRSIAIEVDKLLEEKRILETTSDVLKQLTSQLEELRSWITDGQTKLEGLKDQRSKTDQKRSTAEEQLRETTEELNDKAAILNLERRSSLEDFCSASFTERPNLSVEQCDKREHEIREALQNLIDNSTKRLGRLAQKIVEAMKAFKTAYDVETQEFGIGAEASTEYEQMLTRLQTDDLPRFKDQFKRLLNENTIREVANFHSQLNREKQTIKDRIATINESLQKIDYNEDRYIVLEAQLSTDADIRDFQTELRTCTENAITGSDDSQYSEAKFLQVRQIIQRFRGREGQVDQDQRWTRRVTDVRNWFTFGASERWREDDTEYEHYSDSGGKSGGQKEKLAYTILAASLAYQFGLEFGAARSRSFRFVVIDEAFGRGSDESAQYGLKLFSQLDLQLLVVTPLQKIYIIEPFVNNVGYVHNEEGNSSKLRNLTIEEYKREKARSIQ